MSNLNIRRAKISDIPSIDRLLFQVHRVHSNIRPDLFVSGAKKYTDDELKNIIADEKKPIFVAVSDEKILGYAFCVIINSPKNESVVGIRTLYIDDLCVDESARGQHVGTRIYEYVLDFAKKIGCYNLTLNVWEGNDKAKSFYNRVGLKIQKTCMEKIL